MTETMKAVLCHQHGPVQDLKVGATNVPAAGPGQARIRVSACGINFPDLLLVEGKYQDKPPLPFIPGGEVAGVIDQLGAGVNQCSIGQLVMATTFLGGLAEYVVAATSDIDQLPPGMSMEAAAAFPGVYGTSYHALTQRAQLHAGETLLVLGAAGGTGIAAVQIGKAMGARVIAAASTDDKLEFLAANGADELINYTSTNLRDSVRALTNQRGADVIFDPVGGELFEHATRCINWNGRILVVGFASGTIPRFPVNLALLKGCAIVGVYYGRFREEEPVEATSNMAALCELFRSGKVAPPLHRVFSLDQTSMALTCLENRTVMGKVIVTMTG
jgi:NADPH2:quinone reductase